MKKLTLILLLTLAPTSQAFASEKNKTNPKFFWGAAIAAPSLIIAIGFGTYTIITIKSIEVIEKRINNIQNETVRNALIQDLKSLETQLKIGAIGTGISTLTTLIGLGIIGYGFYENYQEKQVMIANHEKFIDQMEKEYEKFQNSGTKKQVDALKKEKHNREVSLIIWEKAWERGKKRREQFLNRKKIYDKWEKSKNKKMFLQDILGEQLFTLLGGDLIEPKKPQDVLESLKLRYEGLLKKFLNEKKN